MTSAEVNLPQLEHGETIGSKAKQNNSAAHDKIRRRESAEHRSRDHAVSRTMNGLRFERLHCSKFVIMLAFAWELGRSCWPFGNRPANTVCG